MASNKGENILVANPLGAGMTGAPVTRPTSANEHSNGSQGGQAPVAPPAASLGRPPLPRLRSLPTSVASSREGSPRSAVSEAPSITTQAMARLAQYRAGARTFKADRSHRLGLATGDVVAFRTKGRLLAAVPVKQRDSEADSVLHILAPSDGADLSDPVAHFEVIRQGQWVGFRSSMASDRLLQARRRGPHRLAFFSQNLGTWEQWEMPEATALDSLAWTTVNVTLRNRRLPTCELTVELLRVGTCAMMPHAAVTPRSLPMGPTTAIDEETTGENQNVRRMSGLLVNEWLAFVEREKRLRTDLEARMEQAIEDATGLREWAAAQVEGVRQDVEEEVEQLLAALSRKSAALEDVQTRLQTRVRWGVALLEAKKAAVLGRRVLQAWRAATARAKYCRNVVAKLRERADIRSKARVLDAWAEFGTEQRQRRQKLRSAVRRMAFLKMQNVLREWRATMDRRKTEEAAEAAALAVAQRHLREWHLRRLMGGWRDHSRRATVAKRLLQGMAVRHNARIMQTMFTAWQERTCEQKAALACFEVRTASNRRRAALEVAVDAWRVAVDDNFGEQRRMVHAQRVISRRRGVRALQAWRAHVATAKADAAKLRQVEVYERRRRAARALVAWRTMSFASRDHRSWMVRFVHARAERRMQMALHFWRSYTAWKRQTALGVQQAVQRKAVTAMTNVFTFWREETAQAKVQRHRVAICQRRQRTDILRRAVSALRSHAAEIIEERAMVKRAVVSHANRLQVRTLRALFEAVQRQQRFTNSLQSVAAALDRKVLRAAWDIWQQDAGVEKGLEVAVYRFQSRRTFYNIKTAFLGWKEDAQQAQQETKLLARGTSRLEASRLRWVLSVWRSVAAEEAEEQRQVSFGQRRLAKMKLTAGFGAWRHHTERCKSVEQSVVQMQAERTLMTLAGCFEALGSHAVVRLQQRARLHFLVERQAISLQSTVLSAWKAHTQEQIAERAQVRRVVCRLAKVKLASCVAGWRQAAEDSYGEKMRLGTVGLTLATRHEESIMRRMFVAWRGRTIEVAASLVATEARRTADAAAVLRCAFASWRNHAESMAARRAHFVCAMVERRAEKAQALAFAAWHFESKLSTRNSIVVLHRVERAATTACRGAFDAWRTAARTRRERRTALVRLMQRAIATRLGAAFSAWRNVVAEKAAATEELKRCLLRKRIAFRHFKQWYWDSFDEELQGTLRAMFELEEGGEGMLLGEDEYQHAGAMVAISALEHHHHHQQQNYNQPQQNLRPASGNSSRSVTFAPEVEINGGGSPLKSFLSSPIRRDLEDKRSAKSTATGSAPAAPAAGVSENNNSTRQYSNVTFDLPSHENTDLTARVRAALEIADLSPAPPLPPVPVASDTTGSAVLGPLVDWFAPGIFHETAPPPLSPVLEGSESWFGDEEEAPGSVLSSARSEVSSQASTVATAATAVTPPMSRRKTPTGALFATPENTPPAMRKGVPGSAKAVTGPPGTTSVYYSPLWEAKTPWSALAATGVTSHSDNEGSTGGKIAAVQGGTRLDMGPTPPLRDGQGGMEQWAGLGNPLFTDTENA